MCRDRHSGSAPQWHSGQTCALQLATEGRRAVVLVTEVAAGPPGSGAARVLLFGHSSNFLIRPLLQCDSGWFSWRITRRQGGPTAYLLEKIYYQWTCRVQNHVFKSQLYSPFSEWFQYPCWNQLTINVWVYFWALYLIPFSPFVCFYANFVLFWLYSLLCHIVWNHEVWHF